MNYLTSGERRLLSIFICLSEADQQQVLQAATLDPRVSGPLLRAYREVLNLI